MVLLKQLRQVGAKVEAVEGTAESLAVGDFTLGVIDPTAQMDVTLNERLLARGSLSNLPSVMGIRTVNFKFRVEVRGSGAIATAPAWGKFLRGCSMVESAISKITVGTITNTFKHGSTITGGTSTATGRVIGQYSGATTTILYIPLTGTFQNAETITSNDTPAGSASSTSGPTNNVGFEYKPGFLSVPSLTMALNSRDPSAGGSDNMRILAKGCRGNFVLNMVDGEIVFMDFDFKGVFVSATDATNLAPTFETTIPSAYLSAGLLLGSFSPVFKSLTLDCGNEVALRENANDASGGASYRVPKRKPKGTFDPESSLIAQKDWYTDWLNPNASYMETVIGANAAAGNKLKLYAPAFQIESLGDADRSGILVNNIGCTFTSPSTQTDENEFSLVMI